MQIVEALDDARVRDDSGQPTYTLKRGQRYLLYDCEAQRGSQAGALRIIGPVHQSIPPYRGEHLDDQRLVLPFIGRSGDAVVTASCVSSLKNKYPSASVTIACIPAARDVFTLTPSMGRLVAYPIQARRLDRFDYCLSFEEIETLADGPRRSGADVFSAVLHTPRPQRPPTVVIPDAIQRKWELPAPDNPRVALHAARADNLRSYPPDLLRGLVDRFIDQGFEVFLIGADADRIVSPLLSHACVHDLLGRTPTPTDLAAVLSQMHTAVATDSFPMHLAGALGIYTVAIFTATDAILGSDYPSVTALQSNSSCSPCLVADGACPLGHGGCIAHRDPSLAPQSIVQRICSVIETQMSA
ncbi:MAG: glycosyltransferase family 9 protein [Phycisphaerales bacterium]|nr:MAG: glycosyltransferase family 9 protein [Phycisphaerales bacterium]